MDGGNRWGGYEGVEGEGQLNVVVGPDNNLLANEIRGVHFNRARYNGRIHNGLDLMADSMEGTLNAPDIISYDQDGPELPNGVQHSRVQPSRVQESPE